MGVTQNKTVNNEPIMWGTSLNLTQIIATNNEIQLKVNKTINRLQINWIKFKKDG